MNATKILTPLSRQGIERALAHRAECQQRLDKAQKDLEDAVAEGWGVRCGETVYSDRGSFIVKMLRPYTVSHIIPASEADQRPALLGYHYTGRHHAPVIELGHDWRTKAEI